MTGLNPILTGAPTFTSAIVPFTFGPWYALLDAWAGRRLRGAHFVQDKV